MEDTTTYTTLEAATDTLRTGNGIFYTVEGPEGFTPGEFPQFEDTIEIPGWEGWKLTKKVIVGGSTDTTNAAA